MRVCASCSVGHADRDMPREDTGKITDLPTLTGKELGNLKDTPNRRFVFMLTCLASVCTATPLAQPSS